MRKICFALAGSALILAAPAMASTRIIAGGFKNYGDCNSTIHWFANATRWGNEDNWGAFSQYAGDQMECVQVNGNWYIALD